MAVRQLFPEDARFSIVMGVLKLLYHNNRSLSLSNLTMLSHQKLDILLPNMNAAKLMGLVEIKGTVVKLTPLGEMLHVNDIKAKDSVAKKLVAVEPFKTAVKLLRKQQSFTTGDLEESLAKEGLSWHTDPAKNRALLHTVLLQWAIYFDILDYNGRSKTWIESD